MTCFVPYNNRNLDICFLVLKPTVVFVDQLVDTLKHFSSCTESLGCVHSSILQSIHGNMILWYGAWMKRSSDQNKELLNETILSMTKHISAMAVLIDNSFFEAYAGESKDGSPAAKFSTGDTLSITVSTTRSNYKDEYDLPYAILAIFKSHFMKFNGATSGVCLKKCNNNNDDGISTKTTDLVLNIYTWKSLQCCYSFILTSDIRSVVLPYLKGLAIDVKYDIFRVIFVSGDDAQNFQYYSWAPKDRVLENKEDLVKGQ